MGWLTPEKGIESSTRMGSDQVAAEALQEAETEVGAGGKVDRMGDAVRGSGPRRRLTDTVLDVGLTA
ncbi:hypothetical protein Asi03nite_55860 [Actinoplanes siamensis]|uniref:Uncharacterized protein n=1 Tax=Actinoplanes siamensis TaxID=1223317 RepID=A0A919TNC1_9ACTN|nr:hypothetical protein Asi03nite_55860 [Actinoplanes siamensis]